ncbi:MAG: hypothetical protein ACTSX6_06845 [Candidatus Heimdallarchaeaceae archaeon]
MSKDSVTKDDLIPFYEEIVKMRELLQILASDQIKEKVSKIATTKERKRIWALSDGYNNTSDIASKVNVSVRAVQIFLKEMQDAGLITTEKRGYPRRAFDFVPAEWDHESE